MVPHLTLQSRSGVASLEAPKFVQARGVYSPLGLWGVKKGGYDGISG